ncbi:MAG: formate dehydrogenase subunit delta [Gemmatimonadales bacterium]
MNVEHLVEMANQIARFYEAYPDRAEAQSSTARHIRRSWDPRMRRAMLAHIDATGGEGLDPFTLESLRAHRAELTPAEWSARP